MAVTDDKKSLAVPDLQIGKQFCSLEAAVDEYLISVSGFAWVPQMNSSSDPEQRVKRLYLHGGIIKKAEPAVTVIVIEENKTCF